MNQKEQRLDRFCRDGGLSGVYLRRRSNIAWLTDGADVHVDTGSPLGVASVLWTPERKAVYTDRIEAARLLEEEFGDGWEFHIREWWEPEPTPGERRPN